MIQVKLVNICNNLINSQGVSTELYRGLYLFLRNISDQFPQQDYWIECIR